MLVTVVVHAQVVCSRFWRAVWPCVCGSRSDIAGTDAGKQKIDKVFCVCVYGSCLLYFSSTNAATSMYCLGPSCNTFESSLAAYLSLQASSTRGTRRGEESADANGHCGSQMCVNGTLNHVNTMTLNVHVHTNGHSFRMHIHIQINIHKHIDTHIHIPFSADGVLVCISRRILRNSCHLGCCSSTAFNSRRAGVV